MRSWGMGRTKSRYADDAKACRLGCHLQLSPCAPKGRDSRQGLDPGFFFECYTATVAREKADRQTENPQGLKGSGGFLRFGHPVGAWLKLPL